MITRKRINNDIFIRWGIFKPDGNPEVFTNAQIIKLEARAKIDGSVYSLDYTITGNVLDIQFPASKQKDTGIHNLYLEYQVPDTTVEGEIATYTLDYCDAFELVPVSCMLLDPQEDPIVIQGIIASFTYSMLTEEEKNDLAARLSNGAPSIRLTTNSYIIKEDTEGNYSPSEINIKATTINVTLSSWRVARNNGSPQEITEEHSPFPEVSVDGNILTIKTDGNVADAYGVYAYTPTLSDVIIINKVKDGSAGTPGTPGSPGGDGEDGKNTSTAFVYKVSVGQPETPTEDYIPPIGWTTAFPERPEGSRIWLSTREIEDNILIGAWTIPVPLSSIDGKDGEDGNMIEFIYTRTTTEDAPDKPEMENTTDFVPEEWSDSPKGISLEYQFEWVCVREREGGSWGELKGPALWARWGVAGTDGDGVEYVYRQTMNSTKPAPPIEPADPTEDEWYGGWNDNPLGVNFTWKYEWVSVRKKHDGLWGRFSEPAIWAMYGETGPPGPSGADGGPGPAGPPGYATFKSIAFTRSLTAPDRPTGGSWESPLPTSSPQWTDGIPSGDIPVYMTSRIFTSSGGAPQEPVWSLPQPIGDTVDLDFEFSELLLNPGNPTDNPENWSNTASTESYWMAMRKRENAVWGPWNITKIKGEDGKDGIDGDGNQSIYTRTTTDTRPSTPSTSQDDSHMPEGWTRGYTGVTNVYKYEWVSTRTKVRGVWSAYSQPGKYATFSEDGAPGQQGLAGCVVRTSEWASGVEYRNDEALVTTDTRWIDVVILAFGNGVFDVYKCIATHNPSGPDNRPGGTNSSTYWEKFVTMPPIYTPLILADNARIIFNQSHELIIEDEDGVITAGMSGKGTVRFWAGGTDAATAKVRIYEDGSIEGMKYKFNEDGSGYFADGNLSWTKEGDVTVRGKLESNSSGNRIVIDTSMGVGRLRGLGPNDQILFHLGFEDSEARLSLLGQGLSNALNTMSNGRIQILNTDTNAHSLIGPWGIEILNISKSNNFYINNSGDTLDWMIINLPTTEPSTAGTVWRDGNTLKIK